MISKTDQVAATSQYMSRFVIDAMVRNETGMLPE